jgi:DNA primase
VRIARPPKGEDPDDAYRRGGAAALTALLDAAVPAIEAVFAREAGAAPLTTPEAKAGLKQRLRKAAARIADEETRRLYLAELLRRADQLLRPPRPERAARPPWRPDKPGGKDRFRGPERFAPPPAPTESLKASLAQKRRADLETVLGAIVDHPELAHQHAEPLASLLIETQALDAIRLALLDLAAEGAEIDRERLAERLRRSGSVDAAGLVPHLPHLVEHRSQASQQQAEAAVMSRYEPALEAGAPLSLLGMTRDAVAARARARQALGAAPTPLGAATRAEFSRMLHAIANEGQQLQETRELRATVDLDCEDAAFERLQTLLKDRWQSARTAADDTHPYDEDP